MRAVTYRKFAGSILEERGEEVGLASNLFGVCFKEMDSFVVRQKYFTVTYGRMSTVTIGGFMDSGNLMIVSKMLEDFDDIKASHRIDDERFAQGIKFALALSTGSNRTDAYIDAFNHTGDRNTAKTLASKAVHTKWINAIVNRLITGNHIMFADKHYKALEELYRIGMHGDSERNRVDALKGFLEYTKRPDAKVDAPININIGLDMIEKLEAQLSSLAQNAKLLTKSGDIIDVEAIK